VKIAIAAGAMMFYPVRTMFAVCQAAGADSVELMATPTVIRRGPERYVKHAYDVHTCISSVHARLHYRRVSLKQQIESDRASLRFASGIPGCACLVLHPPVTQALDISAANTWLDALCTERESCQSHIQLALENRPENHDGTPRQLLDNLERLRILAGEWGVHLTLDIAHAVSFGLDPLQCIDIVAARLANVHFSDARDRQYRGGIANGLRRDHLLPGDGILDTGAIIDKLVRVGYGGPLTLELSPVSSRGYWPSASRRVLNSAVANMREALAAAGKGAASTGTYHPQTHELL
jgi:sugar phosphate isomerase/epimerase